MAATGTAAASSKVRLEGFGARLSSRAHAYSANPPMLFPRNDAPKTSSPGRNRFMSRPTDSIRPAKSAPAILFFGLRSLPSFGEKDKGPLMVKLSSGLTDEAYN